MRVVLALLVLAIAGCSSYSPDAGHEVVLVEKPILFGHGGVDDGPVKTGRTFTAFTTQGVDVYMQPQKFEAQMTDMVATCESRSDVFRYARFTGRLSPDPHYTSLLGADGGQLTDLGKLYLSLPKQ